MFDSVDLTTPLHFVKMQPRYLFKFIYPIITWKFSKNFRVVDFESSPRLQLLKSYLVHHKLYDDHYTKNEVFH